MTVTALMPDGSRLQSEPFIFNTGILECLPPTATAVPSVRATVEPQLPQTGTSRNGGSSGLRAWWLAVAGGLVALSAALLAYRRNP